MKNLGVQQDLDYWDYLDCWRNDDCVFTYREETAGNTVFLLRPFGADLCDGVVCTALDECHEVGECRPVSGLCTNPVKTNGATFPRSRRRTRPSRSRWKSPRPTWQ